MNNSSQLIYSSRFFFFLGYPWNICMYMLHIYWGPYFLVKKKTYLGFFQFSHLSLSSFFFLFFIFFLPSHTPALHTPASLLQGKPSFHACCTPFLFMQILQPLDTKSRQEPFGSDYIWKPYTHTQYLIRKKSAPNYKSKKIKQ